MPRGTGAKKDVLHVLDGAARAVRFSRELLYSAMENVDHGVNVIDADLRLVAWNSRFAELFRFPPNFLRVGLPVADLIRFLAPPDINEADLAALVERRLEPIRRAQSYVVEREFADGTVVKVVATPMSNGRYVMTYSDITEQHTATRALTQANEQMEERLASSRRELSQAIDELAAARDYAERAALSQARFLAAASHDLLQPLQAARLFVATAAESALDKPAHGLLVNAEAAIATADRMMRALLNLSRYEVRGKSPTGSPVDVGAMLSDLERQLTPMAQAKGLTLRVVPTARFALSDRDLLRSVLQNMLVNAIRYTTKGGVLIGCRSDPMGLRIEVWDSGPGIASEDLDRVFQEFSRLDTDTQGRTGAGLGLSIAERICNLLGHRLAVRSQPGVGSIFSVALAPARAVAPVRAAGTYGSLPQGFRILCVDNDPSVRAGLAAIFTQWGAEVITATTMGEACALSGPWDAIISDYELAEDGNGLDLIEVLFDSAPMHALLAAAPSDAAMERAAALGIEVIRKPAAPTVLRAFLSRAVRAAPAAR
ncbi:MAG: PAS-domain containing protein [Alphaproteobacteria bacterium]|nr:PAS-domain containing protein [Alphaproteobacteria bacterium]